MKQLPVPEGHWFWKNTLQISKGILPFAERMAKKHGSIFMAKTLVINLVVVAEPDYVDYVLRVNNKNYVKSQGYKTLKLFLGEGLLTSEGDFWRKQRRLAQPAFHRKKLEKLVEDMSAEVEMLANEWGKQAKNGPFVVNISDEMSRVAMRIVGGALLGTEVEQVYQQVSHSITYLNEAGIHRITHPLTSLPIWVPIPKNIRFKKEAKALDKIIYGFINERRSNPAERHDLLQMLLDARDEETGEGMSDLQLRDEVMTLFIAGHETSVMALSWTWYLLALNPHIWEKLKTEIDAVLGRRIPVFEDLRNLPYTRQVIDESMRLYPPAWVIGRRPLSPDEVDGYPIPQKSNVLMATYLIHRRPDLWPDPETFDPDRFTPDKIKERHKYAYFPFGGGPRLCIGNNFALMEMQMVLAGLAGKFKPELAQDHPPVAEPLITLRPKSGIQIRFIPQPE